MACAERLCVQQMFPTAAVCGNTSVIKPSERDPGACMLLVQLLKVQPPAAPCKPGPAAVVHDVDISDQFVPFVFAPNRCLLLFRSAAIVPGCTRWAVLPYTAVFAATSLTSLFSVCSTTLTIGQCHLFLVFTLHLLVCSD